MKGTVTSDEEFLVISNDICKVYYREGFIAVKQMLDKDEELDYFLGSSVGVKDGEGVKTSVASKMSVLKSIHKSRKLFTRED